MHSVGNTAYDAADAQALATVTFDQSTIADNTATNDVGESSISLAIFPSRWEVATRLVGSL